MLQNGNQLDHLVHQLSSFLASPDNKIENGRIHCPVSHCRDCCIQVANSSIDIDGNAVSSFIPINERRVGIAPDTGDLRPHFSHFDIIFISCRTRAKACQLSDCGSNTLAPNAAVIILQSDQMVSVRWPYLFSFLLFLDGRRPPGTTMAHAAQWAQCQHNNSINI